VRQGYWVSISTSLWREVDDHAAWVRRYDCASRAGLADEAARRIGAMPYRHLDGPERHAVLYAAMACGLVRVRGHVDHVTIESTFPLQEVLPALAAFMGQAFGLFTLVKIHTLPEGPFLAHPYQAIAAALDRGDLASLLPSRP
jgi:hypothetical protein